MAVGSVENNCTLEVPLKSVKHRKSTYKYHQDPSSIYAYPLVGGSWSRYGAATDSVQGVGSPQFSSCITSASLCFLVRTQYVAQRRGVACSVCTVLGPSCLGVQWRLEIPRTSACNSPLDAHWIVLVEIFRECIFATNKIPMHQSTSQLYWRIEINSDEARSRSTDTQLSLWYIKRPPSPSLHFPHAVNWVLKERQFHGQHTPNCPN